MIKLRIGRRCPIIQMIKVGSEMCAKCEDFGGYNADVQCKSDEDLKDEPSEVKGIDMSDNKIKLKLEITGKDAELIFLKLKEGVVDIVHKTNGDYNVHMQSDSGEFDQSVGSATGEEYANKTV